MKLKEFKYIGGGLALLHLCDPDEIIEGVFTDENTESDENPEREMENSDSD